MTLAAAAAVPARGMPPGSGRRRAGGPSQMVTGTPSSAGPGMKPGMKPRLAPAGGVAGP
jgi:hypothetical protein